MQALAYAHKRGIVHRDASNRAISSSLKTPPAKSRKVVDFGLARPDEETGKGRTLTGTIFGSPLYMSPEQCRGERVDARSDIYSLGCVMYECLTGTVPLQWRVDHGYVSHAYRRAAMADCIEIEGGQECRRHEKVVFKCLAKNPADRYQDAERLEEDLKGLEKNSRSSMWASAASQGRVVRAGASGVFSSTAKYWWHARRSLLRFLASCSCARDFHRCFRQLLEFSGPESAAGIRYR